MVRSGLQASSILIVWSALLVSCGHGVLSETPKAEGDVGAPLGQTEAPGRSGRDSGGKPPIGAAQVQGVATAQGYRWNALQVVAGLRAAFRRCYQQALNHNPNVAGTIKLALRVGPGGEVSSVGASLSGNLPPAMVGCVRARAQVAEFDPPHGGSVVIKLPVIFVRGSDPSPSR